MRTVLRLLIPLAIVLALILPGCYTVVMHPSDEGGYRAQQTSDCVGCHGAYHDYPYGYYYSPYPSWWWEHSAYSSYYAYPWWWRHYDYQYLDDDYNYGGTPANQGTKFDRRTGRSEPAPPPHSIGGGPTPSNWPGLSTPNEFNPGSSGGTATQTRPSSGDSSSGSESKQPTQGQSDSKGVRQSSGRAPAQTVQPDNSDSGSQQPAKDTNTKKSRTKERRGGGGGR